MLLSDDPAAQRLSDLAPGERTALLDSMAGLGEGVEQACGRLDPGFRRVNLEILGNTDPFLHAHVSPRYEWEPAEVRGRPVWLYPQACWSDPATALGPQHDALRRAITERLADSATSLRRAATGGLEVPGEG